MTPRALLLILLLFFSQASAAPIDRPSNSQLKCVERFIRSLDGYSVSAEKIVQDINRYRDPKFLKKLQDEALKQNLLKRGAKCGELGGYACLRKVSAENKERILNGFSVKDAIAKDADLAFLDEKLEQVFGIYFVHNSHHLNTKNPGAVLSAKQLEKLGLSGGANTGHFNDEILGGADNVYFFVKLTISEKPFALKNATSIYGSRVAVPNADYAARYGWISPFVMFPSGLSSVLFTALKRKLQLDGRYRYTDKSIRAQIKHLHQLDFTVSDFTESLKSFAIKRFADIKRSDPALFDRIMSDARIPPQREKNVFASEAGKAFHQENGFPSRFEFKIPVAVPQEHLQVK
jgi:hypothetical protein